jgi:hypothetical protein
VAAPGKRLHELGRSRDVEGVDVVVDGLQLRGPIPFWAITGHPDPSLNRHSGAHGTPTGWRVMDA